MSSSPPPLPPRRPPGIPVLTLLGLLALCSGCGGSLAHLLPVNLQVAISAGGGSDSQTQRSLKALSLQMAEEYMQNNPGVNLHLRFLPEAALESIVRQRSQLAAGPDLLISRVGVAARLEQDGLLTPAAIPAAQIDPLALRDLERFRRRGGYAALPFLIQPALACYNRRAVAAPPRQLQDLVSLADRGVRVGLPLDANELLWTSSAFDAQGPLLQVLQRLATQKAGPQPTPAERSRLLAWLQWLATANVKPDLIFVDSMEDLVARLESGRLDWISCSATSIPRLRRALGSRLAVAPLPGESADQPARALARLLVISFGRDSTGQERQAAQKFALFILNDYSQNNLRVRAVGNLPANQNVIVPSKDSPELASMIDSLDHAVFLPFLAGRGSAGNSARLLYLLKQNVYGEWPPGKVLAALEALPGSPTVP